MIVLSVNGRTASVPGVRHEGAHVSKIQRQRMLLAVVGLAAEGKVESASVGTICARAHVSRRTFYDTFASLEECLDAAFEREIKCLSEALTAALIGLRSWHERVRTGLTVLFSHFDREPGVARLCVIETQRGPRLLAQRRRVLDALIDAVDQGRSEAKGAGPPPLTAETTVGGALSVVHARLVEARADPLVELVSPLVAMIVFPYLGSAASGRELARPAPQGAGIGFDDAHSSAAHPPVPDPFKDLSVRITSRTALVLAAVAAHPGASNREVGSSAGVADQGQISKLLRRLQSAGLLTNKGEGQPKGAPNAWTLTGRGAAVQAAISVPAAGF